jgi:hypothetical protein
MITQMVFVAHPRDANDHVHWLIEVGRFEEALNAAEAGLRAGSGSQVGVSLTCDLSCSGKQQRQGCVQEAAARWVSAVPAI